MSYNTPDQFRLGPQQTTDVVGGQPFYIFKNALYWVLNSGLYRRAGYNHWESELETGNEESPGIGLNQQIIGETLHHDLPLIVYNSERERYHRLNKDELKDRLHRGIYGTYDATGDGDQNVIVLPITCFTEVTVSDPPRMRNNT